MRRQTMNEGLPAKAESLSLSLFRMGIHGSGLFFVKDIDCVWPAVLVFSTIHFRPFRKPASASTRTEDESSG
jgi:hypothetical protein